MKRLVGLVLVVGVVGCGHSERPSPSATTADVAVTGDVQPVASRVDVSPPVSREVVIKDRFQAHVAPLLKKHCLRCHNVDNMKSGIRVDGLDGALDDRWLPLWKGILVQLTDQAMPPEDEPQLIDEERKELIAWIEDALLMARTRVRDKNGTIRRLTVAQYHNTLRDLLGIDDDLTVSPGTGF